MDCMLNCGLANPLGFYRLLLGNLSMHFHIDVTSMSLALYPLGPPSQLPPASSGGDLAYANVNTKYSCRSAPASASDLAVVAGIEG